MPYAMSIMVLLIAAFGGLAYLLTDPSLFLAGIISIPMVMNSIPWGLFPTEPDEPEPDTHAIGFGLPQERDEEYFEDDEEDERPKNKKKR